MGVSRTSLYYVAKQDKKDWVLKVRMEEELQKNPSYGSRRLSQALDVSRPRAQRVMRIFGIKPYRRRGKKYRKSKAKRMFPNLLIETCPSYPNHIWATDFTELVFHGKKIYVSTILDLFTRRLMGAHVAVRKGSSLTVQTFGERAFPPPETRDLPLG
jgi:putative transposase